MSLNHDLRNCKIVIRDVDTGETIADTTIFQYDAETGVVEIETDPELMPEGMVVSALIFSRNGLFESHGTVGDKEGGRIRITLYEGTAQNDRQAVRYQVNIIGEVLSITRQDREKLPGGFEITLLNMSSIGLLVQSPEGKVQVDDIIRFSATSKGQRLTITAKAMRVEEVKDGKENIGCSIQLVNLG